MWVKPSDPSGAELEEVYGNVIIVDTTRWKVTDYEHVAFPDTRTTRANTALVVRLSATMGASEEIVWIHTHLKWNSQDPEREGQVRTLQSLVARYAPVPVIVTGDLYIPSGCTALTDQIGMRKVHTEKTQYFDYPHDPDQVLVPGEIDVCRVDFLGNFKKRHEFSDHSGVRVELMHH